MCIQISCCCGGVVSPVKSAVASSSVDTEIAATIDEPTVDYNSYTVAQLKSIADESGVEYQANIKKADLIAKLEEQA